MHNLGKVLAVIPARGGSKEVPRKNIRNLWGKPLIAYTIKTALMAENLLYRIIVSTDDEEIASISKNYGAEVPFIRPKELSTDEASMVPVLQHAVDFIEKEDNTIIDWILLLQPTDPLREVTDIENSIKLALEDDCDSVISVERVFAHHPILMKKIEKNRLFPYTIEETEGTPRQKYSPPAYMRNGSIYLTKRRTLMKMNSIWGAIIKPLIMTEGSRISIDSMNDLLLAEILMKEKQNR